MVTEGELESVREDELYEVNPYYRLRNECNGVLVSGWEFNQELALVAHAVGMTIALFNGKRTIREIAEIVKPMTKEGSLAAALQTVKGVVWNFTKTDAERKGQPDVKVMQAFPCAALLVPSSIIKKYVHLPRPQYRPKAFLPESAFPVYEDPCGGAKLRAPLKLGWHLTAKCQTNCRYCYLGRRTDVEALSKERVFQIIREARAMGVFYFTLSGADTLLYPHLLDVISLMKELEFPPLQLSTKSYLSRDMAKTLAETDMVYELQFSIDSIVAEIADWMVRLPGFCERTVESIDNALAAGLRVAAKGVITPYNILTVPRLYRELKERGVSEIRLAMYVRSAYHHSDDLYNHPESYEWLKHEVEQLKQEYPDDFVNVQNGEPTLTRPTREDRMKRWPLRNSCVAGRHTMLICVDGKVIPCEQMPEDERSFCGDLKTQSLEEIWHGEELAKRTTAIPVEEFEGTVCDGCADRHECHNVRGYCVRDVVQLHGSIYKPPDDCPKVEVSFIRRVQEGRGRPFAAWSQHDG